MRMRRGTTLTLIVSATLIGGFIHAQDHLDLSDLFPLSHVSTPRDPDAFQLNATSDLVLLDVSVKNPRGGLVSRLEQEKFKIFYNSKPTPLTMFRTSDVPINNCLCVEQSTRLWNKRCAGATASL